MSLWKRSYRKRTTYRKKSSKPFKRRVKKFIAKKKAYGYDGIVKHKFIVEGIIKYSTALPGAPPALVGHHINKNHPGSLDITQATDWGFRSKQYRQMRYKGLKIEVFPQPTGQVTLNKTIKSIHMASYPYDAISDVTTNPSLVTIAGLLQRKDYKVYPGSKFRIKRYYSLSRTIFGPDHPSKEAISSKGWMPISPDSEQLLVQMGSTAINMDCTGWNDGDVVARVVMSYYIEFKEHTTAV